MKKIAKLSISLTILILSVINVKAQTAPAAATPDIPLTDRFKVGVAVNGFAVNGALKESANLGVGLDARLQYKLGNNFDLTLTSGFYNLYTKAGLPTTDGNLTLLHGTYYVGVPKKQGIAPLKLGIKKFLGENVYVNVEGGAGFETQFDVNTKLLLSGGVGYTLEPVDISLRYESFSGQGYNYGLIGLRVAYSFGL